MYRGPILCLFTLLLAASAAHQETRQAVPDIIDTFKNIADPCSSNPGRQIYFPHPSDTTKYIRCDVFGRMFITQCPPRESWNQATTRCIIEQSTTQATAQTSSPDPFNPCTTSALTDNRLYFAYPGDNSRFIECSLTGQANVLACPAHLVWSQVVHSCIYDFQTVQTTPTSVTRPSTGTVTIGTSTIPNPCVTSVAATTSTYYSTPDSGKFIQCDLEGNAFVLSCPANLVWNQFLSVCVHPFQRGFTG
ncbi:hypothetical protein ScPMuIL_009602 [Solemya velum]